MTQGRPEISIVIPTRNGARTLPEVLAQVFRQRCEHSFEVIVVDTASTDGTVELVKRHPVRLYGVRPEEFSHSRTRNYGAILAEGERYLVFLNQDAVPTDDRWLAHLVESFRAFPGLKAVSAAEVVRNGKRPYVSGCSSYAFKSVGARHVHVIEPRVLERNGHLPRARQRELFPFSTVCAMFDRAHFEAHPFDERLVWGEDLAWAVENSRAGFASGCTALARVYHHHAYSPAELAVIMERTAELYRHVFGWECTAEEVFAEGGFAPSVPPASPWRRSLSRVLSAVRRSVAGRAQGEESGAE